MREILFRGKRITNGEWVEGFYHNVYTLQSHSSDRKVTRHHIYTQDFDVIVNGDTVRQFIELTDKNEKKIFIGDIVELFCKGSREHKRYEVFYDIETGQLLMRNGNDVEQLYGQLARNNLTIIGNIYDNPELLEERK